MNIRKFLSTLHNKKECEVTETEINQLYLALERMEGLRFGDTSELAMRLCAASLALNNVTVKTEVLRIIKCDIYDDSRQLSLI